MKFDKDEQMSPLTQKVMGVYNFCGDKLCGLNKRIEAVHGRGPETVSLLLYIILYLAVSYVHEPGTGMMTAWNLAENYSFLEILSELPGRCGEPPLYMLLLAPFAKAGATTVVMAVFGLLFSGLAAALVLFLSPFPRALKLFLPFTYFMFYQYGIEGGIFSPLMLAAVLAAFAGKKRGKRPLVYMLAVLFLGLTSAAGAALALGLAIVWGYSTWKKNSRFTKNILFSVVSVVLSAAILFWSWLAGGGFESGVDFAVKLLYLLFAAPADALVTNAFYGNGMLPASGSVRISFLAEAAVLGAVLLALVFYFGRKKKTAGEFFVPYLSLVFFSMFRDVTRECSGLVFLLLLYWLWRTLEADSVPQEEKEHSKLWERNHRALQSTAALACTLALCISLYWSVSAGVHDVHKEYEIGPAEAEFLRESGLEKYRIMSDVSCFYMLEPHMKPYMDKDTGYLGHNAKTQENTDRWIKAGRPDVFFMDLDQEVLSWYEDVDGSDYVLVYLKAVETMWKADTDYRGCAIYVRRSLASELGLEEITSIFPEKR